MRGNKKKKGEVTSRTFSKSSDAVSYLGGEAWSEFILDGRDGVMSQLWLRGLGHITPIISQRRNGGVRESKGGKTEIGLKRASYRDL